MDKQNLTVYKSKFQKSLINSQSNLIKQSRLILLFNLYDNRFIHEKFLDQIFQNLIENKQMIRYDFQKKIYSLYPEEIYTNFKILNKLKVLSVLSLIFVLLRYIRYKKLIFENFIFLKLYLKTFSKVFSSRLSIIFLILRKNFYLLTLNICQAIKKLKLFVLSFYSLLTFNYLDYKVILEKKTSTKSYKAFYNPDK